MSDDQNRVPQVQGTKADRSGRTTVSIDKFVVNRNDLDSLAELAKIDPSLAKAVIRQKDAEDARSNESYKFGLVVTGLLAAAAMIFVACMVIFGGIFKLVVGIGLVLAVALLIRVIITGEWSETSWFGHLVQLLAKRLGSKTPPEL